MITDRFEDLTITSGGKNIAPQRIDTQSAELAGFESVKAFTVLEREFSQDGREITPTQEIRRRTVEQSFAAEIEAMYVAVE